MKHAEVDEMRDYFRDHLRSSHGWTKAEVFSLRLVELIERHIEVHNSAGEWRHG